MAWNHAVIRLGDNGFVLPWFRIISMALYYSIA